MKFIIVGLGNFGSSLGQKLTARGHEVIGIDSNMSKVELYKEKISHTICLDSTDQFAMSGLPVQDTDIVIVAIGENQGANIMTTALLKNMNVRRLISRAITPLHETVLQAMGVDEIVHPEEETSERLVKKLVMHGVIDSFDINPEYSIVEVEVPQKYAGKTLDEIGFRRNHNLVVLTTLKVTQEKNLLGQTRNVSKVQGVASPRTRLSAGDIMVIYGHTMDIKRLLNES